MMNYILQYLFDYENKQKTFVDFLETLHFYLPYYRKTHFLFYSIGVGIANDRRNKGNVYWFKLHFIFVIHNYLYFFTCKYKTVILIKIKKGILFLTKYYSALIG